MEWLNYHHLLYFWTVAREGGLAPAGKVLRLSQSALSAQIRRLEENLGQELLERRGRKLEMTETGRLVYRYAEQIFGLGKEMMDEVRERPADRPLRLVVGIADVVPKTLVRRLLAPALHGERRVMVSVHEAAFDPLLRGLSAHVLDLVIADAPVPPDSELRLFGHLLGESTVTVIAPSPLAATLRRDFPARLAGAPVVLPLAGSSLRRELDAWFEDEAIRPEMVAEAADSALLKALAAEGMGATFVPTVIAADVAKQYGLHVVGEIAAVRERYHAITAERKTVHPAVNAIRTAARNELFA